MTGDPYEAIRCRNERWWGTKRFQTARRLGQDLHVGAADLLAELVQNAEDAGATTLGLRVLDGGLLVWNDGRPFDDRDVEAISGLFVTSKDAAAIGYFGIGFKVVLSITDGPSILSGHHRFRLEYGLDPYPLDPGDANLPPEAWEIYEGLGSRGAVFWLPWKDETGAGRGVRWDSGEPSRDLDRFLLFLDGLKWIELDGRTWSAERRPGIPSPAGVKLETVILRSPEGAEAFFLRLSWDETLPDGVIEAVVEQLDEEEQKRRWREGPRDVKFGIALRLDPKGRPQAEEGRLFVRLPTGQPTGLPFHLQGRLALTLDRKRLRENARLSRWALETLVSEIRKLPERLKEIGLLPMAWQAFPKSGEGEPPFKDIAQALCKALREGEFFYGDDGRAYSQDRVRLAHRVELYEVLGPDELSEVAGVEGIRWVSPELRHGRATEVIQSLGVAEVGRDDILNWLQTKTAPTWWEARGDDWLQALYRYLQAALPSADKRQEREKFLNSLKELPLVRLEDRRHVRPAAAVLPPRDPSEVPPELHKHLDWLPLVAKTMAWESQRLLQDLGVRDFNVELLFDRLLQRFYGEGGDPTDEETHRQHIRLLFQLRDRVAPKTLEEWGKKFLMLRDRRGRYVKPCEAYLPPDLGGLPEVKTFFSMAVERPFVTPTYREVAESKDDWQKFLESLGVVRLPRVQAERQKWEQLSQEAQEWCQERKIIPLPNAYSTWGWVGVDWQIDGMTEVLQTLEKRSPTQEEAKALWVVGKELHKQSGQVTGAGGAGHWLRLSEAAMTWFYYQGYSQKGTALWVRRLQELAWLPDETGRPRRPGELFDLSLKEVLGSGEAWVFLHPDIRIEDSHNWACVLGLRLSADVPDVCRSLGERLARGAGPEEVRAVYEWLQKEAEKEDVRRVVREQFEQTPLILVPGQGRYRAGEVCWEDPTETLPALKPHWSSLRRLFQEFLGVPDRPTPEAVTQHLLKLLEEKADEAALSKVAQEVERRWAELPEELRDRLKTAQWPGKKGDRSVWERPESLCRQDDRAIAKLFEGRVPWWTLKGLERLADELGVGRISEAKLEVQDGRSRRQDEEKTRRLKSQWEAIRWMARGREVDLPSEPPTVYRVGSFQVVYRWKYVASKPDSSRKAALSDENTVLLCTDDADEWDIGDALEEGWRVPGLREFLKDLRGVEDEDTWERCLNWWKRKLDLSEPLPPYLFPVELHKKPPEPEGEHGQPKVSPEPEPGSRSPRRIRRGRPDPDWGERARLAYQAMQQAKQWLTIQDFEVEDVSGYGLGYDLKAQRDKEVWYVEVKGLRRKGPVVLTQNEWRTAQEKGQDYYLFVYVQDEDQAYLVHPVTGLEPQKRTHSVTEYVVAEWPEKAQSLAHVGP